MEPTEITSICQLRLLLSIFRAKFVVSFIKLTRTKKKCHRQGNLKRKSFCFCNLRIVPVAPFENQFESGLACDCFNMISMIYFLCHGVLLPPNLDLGKNYRFRNRNRKENQPYLFAVHGNLSSTYQWQYERGMKTSVGH